MSESTRRRLLAYAVKKLGRREVARYLKVTEAEVVDWSAGNPEIPNAKLGALADLIDTIRER